MHGHTFDCPTSTTLFPFLLSPLTLTCPFPATLCSTRYSPNRSARSTLSFRNSVTSANSSGRSGAGLSPSRRSWGRTAQRTDRLANWCYAIFCGNRALRTSLAMNCRGFEVILVFDSLGKMSTLWMRLTVCFCNGNKTQIIESTLFLHAHSCTPDACYQ